MLTHTIDPKVEKKARRFWVSLVVLLLGVQVCVGVTAIYLANSDPTVAIIPNYYESAINWDTTRRARQKLTELGWAVDIHVSSEDGSRRKVTATVQDARGEAVEELRLSASGFHHARGAEIDAFLLHEVAPGEYSGLSKLTQGGVWQLKVQLESAQGLAETVQDIEVQ